MDQLLLNVPAWLLATGSIAAWCLCSVGMVAIVRRLIAARPGERHNEVLGMLLGASGIFCAIVVALAVFVVWDHLTAARQAEVDEGASLIALYQGAAALPAPARAQVEGAVRDYTTSVIRDQFPELATGQTSEATERRLSRLNVVVRQYLGGTSAPDQVARVARSQYQLDRAATEGMAPLLWVLLFGACLMLLAMAALLSMENARHHAIGAVLLGGTLGAAVFLIVAADHPFSGPLQVKPSDLVQSLHTYAVMDEESTAASP